jgi:hypothetical protein
MAPPPLMRRAMRRAAASYARVTYERDADAAAAFAPPRCYDAAFFACRRLHCRCRLLHADYAGCLAPPFAAFSPPSSILRLRCAAIAAACHAIRSV